MVSYKRKRIKLQRLTLFSSIAFHSHASYTSKKNGAHEKLLLSKILATEGRDPYFLS